MSGFVSQSAMLTDVTLLNAGFDNQNDLQVKALRQDPNVVAIRHR